MPSHKKRNKQAILAGASSTMAVALALVALVMTSANTSTANRIVSLSIPPFSFQNAYGDGGDNRNQDTDYDEHGVLQQSANNGVGNVAQIRNSAVGTELNSAGALQGGNQQRLAQQVDDKRANNIADDDDRGERSGNARSGSGNSNSLAAGIGSTVLAGTIAAIIGAAAYTTYRIVRVKQKRMALVKGGSNNSSNNAPPS